MNDLDDELAPLLDEAVARLSTYRQTFTDEEALLPIWQSGFDISPQSDPQGRFVLAYEANGRHPRQWRLSTQALANNRLLDELRSGAWNGRDLDAELARLDAEDQTHYVFCPSDPRFTNHPDGTLEPSDSEYNVALSPEARAALDALGPALVEQWRSEGAEPLIVRQVTERLGNLGWAEATAHNGWLLVRTWLLGWSEVARVGQDYWIPSNSIPKGPEHTRLQVLPIVGVPSPDEEQAGNITTNEPGSARRETVPTIDNSPIPQGRETMSNRVSWTYPLRTVHLLEGFIPVLTTARSAYPPRGVGEGDREVLRGLWYDDDERLWLWLDRAQDRLYGPDLADKLEWLEAGDLLRIQWTPDVIVLRLAGHDDEVQREEARLVDLQALKTLRGGLGESYRQSLQAILSEKSEGLTFVQVVRALRDRQGHDVPRNTMRALLYAGGFVRHNSLWFAAPQGELGGRRLRAALAEALIDREESEPVWSIMSQSEKQLIQIQAIRTRLTQVVNILREQEGKR